jgi:polysaccharide deacetylase family protein (PEP-CTERM system associated)
MTSSNKLFLFSVDLEDIRYRMKNGSRYAERVPAMTHRYLEFLSRHKMKCTFFTVGDVARAYPSLIKEIASEGHEIACHSDTHTELDKLGKEKFRVDLQRNMDSIRAAGVNEITGFRAPVFSLAKESAWAYEVFAELGIKYSSSVLPAKSPLYGWPEFGAAHKMVSGVLEIPMSVSSFGPVTAPEGGGVYFRVFPFFLVKSRIKKRWKSGEPVLGYFHPYDIDDEQERFVHPDIDGSKIYNFILYYNRKNTLKRLEEVLSMGAQIIPYRTYAARILASQ